MTRRGLVREAGDPGSGLDSAAAWAVRPFPRPVLIPAARRTLRALIRSQRARSGPGAIRFGIVPSQGWNEADPWTAPTAWSAWSLAALARLDGRGAAATRDRRAALELLAALRHAATPAGLLPERVDARTGVPRSTAPLAWSHAFAVLALRELWPSPGTGWVSGFYARRMHVREARLEDCEAIARGMKVVVEEGRWLATAPGTPVEDLVERFRAAVEWDGQYLFVLEDGGEPVGSIGLHPSTADGVLSLGMWILPEWRGRGGGRMLIEAALAAVPADAHKVELEVFPDNEAAIALYREFGFEQEGLRRDHHRRDDGSLRSAILMARLYPPAD